MNKILLVSAAFAFIAATGARAQDVVISPDVDTWVMTQPDTSVDYDGDIVIGAALPGTVTYVEIPDQPDIAYVVVNKKRVLVNKKTRKVVKVYE